MRHVFQVKMTLKPSAENLFDGDDRAVLGLVWALMMKYLKFATEDDESMSPKDALLRWVNLNVSGYGLPEVKNFTKSFHDGRVFCALLHKFRPGLIDMDKLDPATPTDNLEMAMRVAEEFFGLERYLTPDEIPKLDEKAMLVYASEYYSGITAQLKLDLAGKRISHLVSFTITNDKLKADYTEGATALQTVIQEYVSFACYPRA